MSEPQIPQVPHAPQEPTTHYRPVDSRTFGCNLGVEYGTEAAYAPDATCGHCQMVLAAEQAQPLKSVDDEGLTADEIREGYNLTILEEALACQETPGEWQDPDEELGGQIALVQQLFGQPGVDHAVDHLRVMLEISYLEPSELPERIPAARGPVVTGAPGAHNEVFTFTVTLTRAQLDWITSALGSMENNGPTGEARAAAVLGGQIPAGYYTPGA